MPKVDEAHVEKRRMQILEAAFLCFSEKGFHESTMRDICRRAGLSPGAVYGYFQGKAEIVEALAAMGRDNTRKFIAQTPSAEDSRDALTEIVLTFVEVFNRPVSLPSMRLDLQMWGEAMRNERIRKLFLAGARSAVEPFASMVRGGCRRRSLLSLQQEPTSKPLATYGGAVMSRSTLLLGLSLALIPRVAAAAITDPRLILHADAPDCQLTIHCPYDPPSVSLGGPGPITIHLLVHDMGEEFQVDGSITGVQTAFTWDDWTLVSSYWSCLPGQITVRDPSGPGPYLGTLTTTFDPIVAGTTAVVGWMEMLATTGALWQIESSLPMGTHVTDGSMQPVAVPAASRGLVRVEGPGLNPCDPGCHEPLTVMCQTNILQNPEVHVVGSRITWPALGDVDSDQNVDIVTSADGYLAVLRGLGAGMFAEPMFGPDDVGAPYLEDRNGDSHLDVVARTWAGQTFGVWLGHGDGTFAEPTLYPSGGIQSHVFLDVNDDSMTDVVGIAGGGVGVLLGDDGGGFEAAIIQNLAESVLRLDAGDVNGDDYADLAVIVESQYDYWVRVYAGLGDGTFDLSTALLQEASFRNRDVCLTDFTGDGLLDLMWVHYTESYGQTWIEQRIGQGDGTFVTVNGTQIAACGRLTGAHDLGGDGHPDLISTGGGNCTSHAFCGYPAILEVAAGDGSGSYGARLVDCDYELGRWASVAVGDIDGDEAADLVVTADPAVIVYRANAATGVEVSPAPAPALSLHAQPNPVWRTTDLLLSLDTPAIGSLRIYDAAGRQVRTLVADVPLSAGQHRVQWDATDRSGRQVPAGVYMARLDLGDAQISEKLIVVR
jgi:AcrR family transcriptional regulator